jgi:hypothetical protein
LAFELHYLLATPSSRRFQMLIPSLPMNILTGAASQFLSGAASHASFSAKSFESNLDSGNIAGAQSFLSTLQQTLSQTGSNSAVSSGIAQVGSDLKSGNVAAAKLDFGNLRQSLEQLGQTQNSSGAGDTANASLAAMNALRQGAYSAAINLSMPASTSSLSVSL